MVQQRASSPAASAWEERRRQRGKPSRPPPTHPGHDGKNIIGDTSHAHPGSLSGNTHQHVGVRVWCRFTSKDALPSDALWVPLIYFLGWIIRFCPTYAAFIHNGHPHLPASRGGNNSNKEEEKRLLKLAALMQECTMSSYVCVYIIESRWF